MQITDNFISEILATLIGIFIGTLAAFAVDRFNENKRKKKRAKIILRSILQELNENFDTMRMVRNDYVYTPWGRSFYLSTIAWEMAVSSGDLPDIIGFELADIIGAQYAILIRVKYYVDLLTQLWFAPKDIPGYDQKRDGFTKAILKSLNNAINSNPGIVKEIEKSI